MNSKVLISLTFLCFILISCDSGMKWNNPLDPESKTYQACEESEEGKSRCFNAYSIQICKDGVWQYPQNCQKYEYCDEGKGECRAKDACTENPCAKILHSDGACKTTEDGFECGCEGYARQTKTATTSANARPTTAGIRRTASVSETP